MLTTLKNKKWSLLLLIAVSVTIYSIFNRNVSLLVVGFLAIYAFAAKIAFNDSTSDNRSKAMFAFAAILFVCSIFQLTYSANTIIVAKNELNLIDGVGERVFTERMCKGTYAGTLSPHEFSVDENDQFQMFLREELKDLSREELRQINLFSCGEKIVYFDSAGHSWSK